MAPENPAMTLDPKYDHYDFPTTAPEEQLGHPGHLNAQQEAQVHQLRMKLEQAGYTERLDTLTLLRFLRARKFDVALSEKMFIECEKWRKDFNLDWLIRNFDYKEKPEVFKYYPQYYHKTDKDGRPVYIEQLGNIDLTAINKITTSERMLQNLAVEYEKLADPRLPACSRKAGQLLETCCTVMDLKGVGLSRVSSVYAYVKQASALSQNYYPERLGHMYLINAPWGFSSVFSVVKGFLDPVTVKKIHVLGSNYQQELLEQVPAENLPQLFGGTCDCPGGCGFSDDGPWQDPQWAKPPKWALDAPEEGDGKKSKAEEAAIENQAGSTVGADSEPPPPAYSGNPEATSAPGDGNEPDNAAVGSIPATGTTGAVPALEEIKPHVDANA